MGPVVEPGCKILTGKEQEKKLLKSEGVSRGDTNTDLGNQRTERKKV